MYPVPEQSGRIIVVTGANSGTGLEASHRLATAGARVVMAVRNRAKGEAAARQIQQRHADADLEVRVLDLADLASVRSFADDLARDHGRIDTLLNNAGVMVPPQRLETADGFELQIGTNFLGPLALTNLVLPLLLAAPTPRVVTMCSGVANFGRIDLTDLNWMRRRYSPEGAYAQSKLADVHLFRHLAVLAERSNWNLTSVGAHPGYTHTNLQTSGAQLAPGRSLMTRMTASGLMPGQPVEQGAEPMLMAAAEPGLAGGSYYGPTGRFGLAGPPGPARLNKRMSDAETAARLWAYAQLLTGTAAG
ncbi:MAG: SDR family oxidoreductase [Beutenbergiaceae bacterium]